MRQFLSATVTFGACLTIVIGLAIRNEAVALIALAIGITVILGFSLLGRDTFKRVGPVIGFRRVILALIATAAAMTWTGMFLSATAALLALGFGLFTALVCFIIDGVSLVRKRRIAAHAEVSTTADEEVQALASLRLLSPE